MVGRRAAVVLACCVLPACQVPMLVSESTLTPVIAVGHGAQEHGVAGLDTSATVRAADVRAGGAPTPTTLYVPRLQLDVSFWVRAGRYVTVSVVSLVALSADAFGATPSPLPKPTGDAWAVGGAVAGRIPVDAENRFDVDLNLMLGVLQTDATFVDRYACGYGCMPMTGAPYTEHQSPTTAFGAAHARWVHRFGPVSTILIGGLGMQPVNGALGGTDASVTVSPMVLVGGGIHVDVTEWLGAQLLVVVPLESGGFQVGPLLSFGFTIGGGSYANETPPPTLLH